MRLLAAFAALALAVSPPAAAEQVLLKSGGRLTGLLLQRTPTHVVLLVGPGQVAIPLRNIDRVVAGVAPLASYKERAALLTASDRDGWLDLGVWARDEGLLTQARECFERVAALDPANPIAQSALGNVLMGGRWVTPEESYRARGYVRFEGSWMSPEERDESLRDRAERRAEAAARAESERRIAESEARVRAAEAASRRVETPGDGIPLGYVLYGGGFGYGMPRGLGHRIGQPPTVAAPPAQEPAPRVPISSFGPNPSSERARVGYRDRPSDSLR